MAVDSQARLQTHTRALRKECRRKKIEKVAEIIQADNVYQAAKRFAPQNPEEADSATQGRWWAPNTHEAQFRQIVQYLLDGQALAPMLQQQFAKHLGKGACSLPDAWTLRELVLIRKAGTSSETEWCHYASDFFSGEAASGQPSSMLWTARACRRRNLALQTQLVKQAPAIANSHSMFTKENCSGCLPLPPVSSSGITDGYQCWDQIASAPAQPEGPARLVAVDRVLHETFCCDKRGQSFTTQASLRRHVYRNQLSEDQQQKRDALAKQPIKRAEMAHALDGMPQCKHCKHCQPTSILEAVLDCELSMMTRQPRRTPCRC
eukprot:s2078_g1.t1